MRYPRGTENVMDVLTLKLFKFYWVKTASWCTMNVVFSEKEKMTVLTGFLKFYVYCTTVLKYTKTT